MAGLLLRLISPQKRETKVKTPLCTRNNKSPQRQRRGDGQQRGQRRMSQSRRRGRRGQRRCRQPQPALTSRNRDKFRDGENVNHVGRSVGGVTTGVAPPPLLLSSFWASLSFRSVPFPSLSFLPFFSRLLLPLLKLKLDLAAEYGGRRRKQETETAGRVERGSRN